MHVKINEILGAQVFVTEANPSSGHAYANGRKFGLTQADIYDVVSRLEPGDVLTTTQGFVWHKI